jgi:hypothetical protein
MTHFDLEDDDVLPNFNELEDFQVPEALDGRTISFDQMRHTLDQMFESDVIPDTEAPDSAMRIIEAESLYSSALV